MGIKIADIKIYISKMLLQKVQLEKVLRLSPAWVNLFEIVQNNPYIIFKEIEFFNGEPKIGLQTFYDKNGKIIADKSYKF